jgi:DNA-binding transcriptional ArsR family regulator
MDITDAVEALSALAQEHRLAVFRLLVCEGPNGLPAGAIAERIAVPPSTLSHHLAHLERAGLLRSWRVERRIFYAVDIDGTRRMVAFLTEDCCQGHPEICGYEKGGSRGDDHHLPQPRLRDVAECPCDDPKLR